MNYKFFTNVSIIYILKMPPVAHILLQLYSIKWKNANMIKFILSNGIFKESISIYGTSRDPFSWYLNQQNKRWLITPIWSMILSMWRRIWFWFWFWSDEDGTWNWEWTVKYQSLTSTSTYPKRGKTLPICISHSPNSKRLVICINKEKRAFPLASC